jgi:hypothetical protein
VREALRRYEQAYESLDVAAVQRVQPLSPEQVRTLEKSFPEYRSFTVDFENLQIAVDGTRATATTNVRRSFTPRVGRGATTNVRTVFHLEQARDAWVITRVEAR